MKKPFGLSIGCKVAEEAMKARIVPLSVVLSNLIKLQKSTVFPEKLEKQYFMDINTTIDGKDKPLVTKILVALNSPLKGLFTYDLLESYIKDGWVEKKSVRAKDQVVKQVKAVIKKPVPVKKVSNEKKDVKVTFKTKKIA